MSRPRGRIDAVCQNPDCEYYRQEWGKDIVKRGKDAKTSRQRYSCNHCKKFFMETKGTPLFRKHFSEGDLILTCKLLVEKNGIRSIEWITGHHRDTIGNLLTDIAEHATEMNEFLIRELGPTPTQCDEFWIFIKESKRNLSQDAQDRVSLAMHGSAQT